MVRKIFLLRHGQAEESGYDTRDFDRVLTNTGMNQVRSLGRLLNHEGFYPDEVFCSTAVRARQTAENLLEEINYLAHVDFLEDIYEASLKSLLDIVTRAKKSTEVILLVGHNPAITYLAEYLTNEPIGTILSGGLVRISVEVDSWEEVSKGMGTVIAS